MNNNILILGILLIIAAIISFVNFRIKYKEIVQRCSTKLILELSKKYVNEDDIVSHEDAETYFKKFEK